MLLGRREGEECGVCDHDSFVEAGLVGVVAKRARRAAMISAIRTHCDRAWSSIRDVDDLIPVLTKFHRQIVLPDIERVVASSEQRLRDEMQRLFDSLAVELKDLRQAYTMLSHAVARIEERLERVEQRLEKMALRSELLDLKAR